MRDPSRHGPERVASAASARGLAIGVAVATSLAMLVTASARADGPAPATPPAPSAATPAVDVGPAPEKVPVTEFLGPDLVRRADGMMVRYYRVNFVAPAVLAAELDIWKSPKAQITASGVMYTPASASSTAPKTAPVSNLQNVLRIIETEENWPVLERILSMVDLPQPQVRVEAKVLELTWDDQLKIGVSSKITRPVGDTFLQSFEAKFPNALDALNGTTAAFRSADKYLTFDYAVQAVEQGAHASVLSQPSILASQGETAVIRSGDQEPYVRQNISGNAVTTATDFKDVGIRLEVQPMLIGRDGIRVRILAEASRLSDFRVTATSANQQVVNPVISQRTADTVVTVPNGETLVIGGLEQSDERDTRTGIPLLKDIPVLGWAFGSTSKRKTKTELVFWITLTIERPEEARLVVPSSERVRALMKEKEKDALK
ncbi:MAG: type II and III secretion system protein [Planctomycetes bacterium]|nr:type II and III secretion system protein [Planctomycetota bacterium]